jgi:hypothetical protein
MYIKDNYLNTIKVATEQESIQFQISSDPASQGNSRFELIFSPQEVTSNLNADTRPEFRIFPNPSANGEFQIVIGKTDSGSQLLIMDITGKVVFEKMLEENLSNWKIKSDLPSGVYQAVLFSNGQKLIQKISINR